LDEGDEGCAARHPVDSRMFFVEEHSVEKGKSRGKSKVGEILWSYFLNNWHFAMKNWHFTMTNWYFTMENLHLTVNTWCLIIKKCF